MSSLEKKEEMNNIIVDPDIKGLIFDCDGTLVDSMPTHMEAWEYAFKQFNTKYDQDFLFSFKGMKDTDIVEIYNKTFGTALNGEALVSMKNEYFLKNLNKIQPIKPVVDVANRYYKKLPLAVVSGNTKSIVHDELNFAGIAKLFDVVLTADDPFAPKPDPEIFLAAASQLKVDPLLCIVFEDGDAGLEAALKAGMKIFDVRTLFDN
jgi:beta-phosphoglucomutase-like phosphatase (HAD superfamily)